MSPLPERGRDEKRERRERKRERESRQTEDLIYPSLGLMSGHAKERERERIMGDAREKRWSQREPEGDC